MDAEQLPKEFEKTTEVLPFTKYGISSYEDFKKTEDEIQHLEYLKKTGLTKEEIKLYQDNEAGLVDQRKKVESNALKNQLKNIYGKINAYQQKQKQYEAGSSKESEEASTSETNIFERLQKQPIKFYPEGHPMNEIKELEQTLFGHLKDDIIPVTKRRKILRRLERRKERIQEQGKQLILPSENLSQNNRKGSLWDIREPVKTQQRTLKKPIIGPKKQTMYTIKESKIVRLEPVEKDDRLQVDRSHEESIHKDRLHEERLGERLQERNQENIDANQEYRAVDIVIPVNAAEEQLLEGTKMCIDDIKKIDRFRDYEPGVPSKVLYLKNIAQSVTQEELSVLFNQFQLENGGPIDVRLLTGRMRGQAFVSLQSEDLAIRALEEVNGTILSGKPVIVQFGRNSNRIQEDDYR